MLQIYTCNTIVLGSTKNPTSGSDSICIESLSYCRYYNVKKTRSQSHSMISLYGSVEIMQ